MNKRITALLLCLLLCLSLLPMGALAAKRDFTVEENMASRLKSLGLFKGISDTDFGLETPPNRAQALVMLVRILGKEKEAMAGSWKMPFTDVPSYAQKHVAYAYAKGLTNGVSATKFGSTRQAGPEMYLTFMLRALDYSDKKGDFTWNNPYSLARRIGILPSRVNTAQFLRGDLVTISYAALSAKLKGSNQTLAQKLINAGAFSSQAFSRYYKAGLENQTVKAKAYLPDFNAFLGVKWDDVEYKSSGTSSYLDSKAATGRYIYEFTKIQPFSARTSSMKELANLFQDPRYNLDLIATIKDGDEVYYLFDYTGPAKVGYFKMRIDGTSYKIDACIHLKSIPSGKDTFRFEVIYSCDFDKTYADPGKTVSTKLNIKPAAPKPTPTPSPDGTCSSCRGDGDCSRCNGTGRIRRLLAGTTEWVEQKCTSCRPAGSGNCPFCGGDGRN